MINELQLCREIGSARGNSPVSLVTKPDGSLECYVDGIQVDISQDLAVHRPVQLERDKRWILADGLDAATITITSEGRSQETSTIKFRLDGEMLSIQHDVTLDGDGAGSFEVTSDVKGVISCIVEDPAGVSKEIEAV